MSADQARRSYEFGEASISAGSFAAVVSFTPDDNVLLTGFNCDMASILSTNYRYRLKVDGNVVVHEVLATTGQSWIPVEVSVGSGVTVAVELLHNEASAQDSTATVAYRERA